MHKPMCFLDGGPAAGAGPEGSWHEPPRLQQCLLFVLFPVTQNGKL